MPPVCAVEEGTAEVVPETGVLCPFFVVPEDGVSLGVEPGVLAVCFLVEDTPGGGVLFSFPVVF